MSLPRPFGALRCSQESYRVRAGVLHEDVNDQSESGREGWDETRRGSFASHGVCVGVEGGNEVHTGR